MKTPRINSNASAVLAAGFVGLAGVVLWAMWSTIASIIDWLMWGALLAVGIAVLILLIRFAIDTLFHAADMVGEHKHRSASRGYELAKLKAEARRATLEAEKAAIQVHTTDAGQATYLTHVGGVQSETTLLHLHPGTHANGHVVTPSDSEQSRWLYHTAAHGNQKALPPGDDSSPLTIEAPLMELPTKVPLLDLLPMGKGRIDDIILGISKHPHTGQLDRLRAPIWKLVHIAGGGATDSGKSNFIRAIAYQVTTARNTQIAMIDLKKQTFKAFRDSDKLLYPIITSIQEFTEVVAELRAETERRLSLFEPYITVETIHDYNQKVDEPLPYVVAFVDEISNIFRDKDAEASFLDLIRISRAAGVYFVCSGQTWDHKTLSTSTRQQFRTAFHFGTNDKRSSQMLLNDSRATEIQQQGRAYAALAFGLAPEVVEVQTPYLSLETVVETLAMGEEPAPIRVQKIHRLYEQGLSMTAIAREINGVDKANTRQINEVKEVLGLTGLTS